MLPMKLSYGYWLVDVLFLNFDVLVYSCRIVCKKKNKWMLPIIPFGRIVHDVYFHQFQELLFHNNLIWKTNVCGRCIERIIK